MIPIPPDFSDILRLLNAHGVRYLLVGGYAVAVHGYPRPTADMDIWVAADPQNADRVVQVLQEFGFDVPELDASMIHTRRLMLRMGYPPVRIEFLCDLSAVEFESCYARREQFDLNGVPVQVISLSDLRKNKQASGRSKDKVDLDYLPET